MQNVCERWIRGFNMMICSFLITAVAGLGPLAPYFMEEFGGIAMPVWLANVIRWGWSVLVLALLPLLSYSLITTIDKIERTPNDN